MVASAGGMGENYGRGITVDGTGNCYVTGVFSNTANFGTYSVSSSVWSDVFVAKFGTDNIWQWASDGGGSQTDYVESVSFDGV